MPICETTNETSGFVASAFALFSGQDSSHQQKTIQPARTTTAKYVPTLASVVADQLSRVNEVENVFLECDQENGKAYRVVSIVNARDPQVRARIYEKEQEVMNSFPGVDFSFRVISRANRDLSEVVDGIGRIVYRKG